MILGNNKKNKDIDDYEYNNSNGRKSISNVIDNFNNMGVSKYIPVLVMIFLIVLIIFYAFYSKNKDEFKSIKINSSLKEQNKKYKGLFLSSLITTFLPFSSRIHDAFLEEIPQIEVLYFSNTLLLSKLDSSK